MLKIDDAQLKLLYLLKEGKEKGEYLPLTILKMKFGEDIIDLRVVAIELEKIRFVECVVDDNLIGEGKYKYKLTPEGYGFIQNVLKSPGEKKVHILKKKEKVEIDTEKIKEVPEFINEEPPPIPEEAKED